MFLHNNGITLCDFDTHSIYLDNFLYPKLYNFGFSDIKNDLFSKSSQFKPNSRDAYLYMAPEVMEKGMYSKYSDVYSFGVLACEILTQRNPFAELLKTDYLTGFINKIVKEKYRPELNIIDSDYLDLVEKCMLYIPEERPTFNEIVEILKKLLFVNCYEEYQQYIYYIEDSEICFNPNVFIYFDKYFNDNRLVILISIIRFVTFLRSDNRLSECQFVVNFIEKIDYQK